MGPEPRKTAVVVAGAVGAVQGPRAPVALLRHNDGHRAGRRRSVDRRERPKSRGKVQTIMDAGCLCVEWERERERWLDKARGGANV